MNAQAGQTTPSSEGQSDVGSRLVETVSNAMDGTSNISERSFMFWIDSSSSNLEEDDSMEESKREGLDSQAFRHTEFLGHSREQHHETRSLRFMYMCRRA